MIYGVKKLKFEYGVKVDYKIIEMLDAGWILELALHKDYLPKFKFRFYLIGTGVLGGSVYLSKHLEIEELKDCYSIAFLDKDRNIENERIKEKNKSIEENNNKIFNNYIRNSKKELRRLNKYGNDWKEFIVKKWNYRKLSRKLPERYKEKVKKI